MSDGDYLWLKFGKLKEIGYPTEFRGGVQTLP